MIKLPNRHELLRYCASRRYRRIAEIGVSHGHYSERILRELPEAILYSIDPWRNADGNFVDSVAFEAIRRLSQYGERSLVLIGSSPSIAHAFANGWFDLVYIDADHQQKAVAADLRAWYPKVRAGGMLAGDDYGKRLDGLPAWERWMCTPGCCVPSRGVMAAVNAFADEMELELQVTTGESRKVCPNWWFIKPG